MGVNWGIAAVPRVANTAHAQYERDPLKCKSNCIINPVDQYARFSITLQQLYMWQHYLWSVSMQALDRILQWLAVQKYFQSSIFPCTVYICTCMLWAKAPPSMLYIHHSSYGAIILEGGVWGQDLTYYNYNPCILSMLCTYQWHPPPPLPHPWVGWGNSGDLTEYHVKNSSPGGVTRCQYTWVYRQKSIGGLT